jgi:hypothetical protein
MKKYINLLAMTRLSSIFKIPLSCLDPSLKFGVDLNASFNSDFKRNELDIILEDILDVMDSKLYKNFKSKKIIIETVNDYCTHMNECYNHNPTLVESVLKTTE